MRLTRLYLPDKLLQASAIAGKPGGYNHNCHQRIQVEVHPHVWDDGVELYDLKIKRNCLCIVTFIDTFSVESRGIVNWVECGRRWTYLNMTQYPCICIIKIISLMARIRNWHLLTEMRSLISMVGGWNYLAYFVNTVINPWVHEEFFDVLSNNQFLK
jgi:hypothetical protein